MEVLIVAERRCGAEPLGGRVLNQGESAVTRAPDRFRAEEPCCPPAKGEYSELKGTEFDPRRRLPVFPLS